MNTCYTKEVLLTTGVQKYVILPKVTKPFRDLLHLHVKWG